MGECVSASFPISDVFSKPIVLLLQYGTFYRNYQYTVSIWYCSMLSLTGLRYKVPGSLKGVNLSTPVTTPIIAYYCLNCILAGPH